MFFLFKPNFVNKVIMVLLSVEACDQNIDISHWKPSRNKGSEGFHVICHKVLMFEI